MPPESVPASGEELVSKTKMLACNTNIILWRLKDHEKSTWVERDLKILYKEEVEPIGYSFPFIRVLRSLYFQKFVSSNGRGTGEVSYSLNRGKINWYITLFKPPKPPQIEKQTKTNATSASSPQQTQVLKFLKHLIRSGYSFSGCAMGEAKLEERFAEAFPRDPQLFPTVMGVMSRLGIAVHKDGKYKFSSIFVEEYMKDPVAFESNDLENVAFAYITKLSKNGLCFGRCAVRETKLKEKFVELYSHKSLLFPDLLQFIIKHGLINKSSNVYDRYNFNSDLVRQYLSNPGILTQRIKAKPSRNKLSSSPSKPDKKPAGNTSNGQTSRSTTNLPLMPLATQLQPMPIRQHPVVQNGNTQRFLRGSRLLAGSRREWSSSTGNLVKDRKTFVDQRSAFLSRAESTLDLIVYPQDVDYCSYCSLSFANNEELEEHNDTSLHKFMVVYSQNRGQGMSSKTPPHELSGTYRGILIQSSAGKEGRGTHSLDVIMENEEPVKININLEVLFNPPSESEMNCFLVETLIVVGDEEILKVADDSPLNIELGVAKPKTLVLDCAYPGFLEYVLAFRFCYANSKGTIEQEFFVMKNLQIKIDFEGPQDEQETDTPKRQKFHMDDEKDYNIVEPPLIDEADFPPLPQSSLILVNKLFEYPLPWRLIRYFNYGFTIGPDPWLSTLKSKLEYLDYLEAGTSVPNNYAKFFGLLMFLEEHQILCDLRMYALQDATLQRVGTTRNFYLTVPGLAENRPSVLPRDVIYITTHAGVHKGYINVVEQKRVKFNMGTRFVQDYYPGLKVAVHFSFNRSCLRVQHRAIELMQNDAAMAKTLFPWEHGTHESKIEIASWFNPRIRDNPMQKQAVQNILNGSSMPAPYLLFGPPGTGKTVTMVESMKQVYMLREGSRILAAAPSNAAADLLAQKLLDSVPPGGLIRLYSPSVKFSKVPLQLQPVSNFKDGMCVFPDLKYLMQFKIVIVTLICAGRLYSGNFPPGHFSHIFIDECGHGMEPSALVPIAGLKGTVSRPSQIVLSGDPKQLGPIVRSPVAISMGLGDSLLVRMMDAIDMYQKSEGGYNAEVLTKLTYNYRSHPQILKVPNELFYDGELLPCGDVKKIASACDLDWLPQQGFPLIFHGVNGKDEQNPHSPSFFNTAEVFEVLKYVKKIMASEFNGGFLKQSDIGIVSPYRGQLNKLRNSLDSNGFPDVCVGSVEEFQGQERRVIIISTVRSNPAQLKLDHKFNLGFVREPRRFNVAVTRASALLIVIGNPHLLQTDKNWRRLLEHIYINGGYTHTNCPFKLGPPVQYQFHSPDDNLAAIRRKLMFLRQQIMDRIDEMEKAGNQAAYDPTQSANDPKVDELLEQIKRLNFFTEDGPGGYIGDE